MRRLSAGRFRRLFCDLRSADKTSPSRVRSSPPFFTSPQRGNHESYGYHGNAHHVSSNQPSYRHLLTLTTHVAATSTVNILSYRGSDACTLTNDGRSVCGASYRASTTPAFDAVGNKTFAMAETGSIIGSRPAGCPNRYCGCGLRKYLGLSDVRLNLASNWARLLPREAGPRPGLAAVRSDHVMYIEFGRRQRPMADPRLQFRRRTVANARARRARVYLRQPTRWDGKGIARPTVVRCLLPDVSWRPRQPAPISRAHPLQ